MSFELLNPGVVTAFATLVALAAVVGVAARHRSMSWAPLLAPPPRSAWPAASPSRPTTAD